MKKREAGKMVKQKAVAMSIMLLLGLLIGLGGRAADDLAELYVQKIVLDPPSAVMHGVDVEIYARIVNSGERTADRFDVGLFYRLQGESWSLLGTVESEHLPPSQQDFLEVTFVLKTGELKLATYEIRVVADITNEIPEIDELNNTLQTTLTLLPSTLGLSDLQPVELTFARTEPNDDMAPWEVNAVVRNTGDQDAGPFRTTFRIGETVFDEQFTFGLPAGSYATLNGVLQPYDLSLTPGTYSISVSIDADDQVAEQDEANNLIKGALTIQALELHPISLAFDKSIVHLDEEVKVTSKITNEGKGIAKTLEVAFYVNRVKFAAVDVGPIGFNQTVNAEGILDLEKLGFSDAPKEYEIRVVVDPSNLLHESDEANNEMIRPLTILKPEPKRSELHPESLELTPPSPAELGKADMITVSSVISNTGKAAAEGFDVSFAYRTKGALRWEPFLCSDRVSCTELALAPGAELRVNGVLPVAGISPGIYEIRIAVDPLDGIEEVDETNNALATTLSVLASRLPDLVCVSTEVEPAVQVRHGQTLRLSATISNLGDADAGPFEAAFAYCRIPEFTEGSEPPAEAQWDFRPFAVDTVKELAVGESDQVRAILETKTADRDLQPGLYYIRVSVDPAEQGHVDGQIREQSEFNNVCETSVLIQGADLIPAALDLLPPSPVVHGEEIEIVATILNIGVEPAGEFCVAFYARREPAITDEEGDCAVACAGDCTIAPTGDCDLLGIGGVKFLGLDAETAETVRCALDTTTLEPGTYQIFVDVDAGNAVAEQYEANNRLMTGLVIQFSEGEGPGGEVSGVDLVPLALTLGPSSSVEKGQKVTISVTIANRGEEPAGPFVVNLFRNYLQGPSSPFGTGEFGMLTFEELDAGESSTRRLSLFTSTLRAGDYAIKAVVDAAAQVDESNEGNNQIEEILTIFP
jgi:subtilase family serine protease